MNVADQVIAHIRTQLAVPGSSIDLDSNLATEGHLDSTAMLELILWVGDTFGVVIQNEDLTPENFATPRLIAEFVQQRGETAVTVLPEAELEPDAPH